MKVIITSKGLKGHGVYVGRPTIFGNPFPDKPSKYDRKVYTTKESIAKYIDWFKHKFESLGEFRSVVTFLQEQLKIKKVLILDCWCVDKIMTKPLEDPYKATCHAEIIAHVLLGGKL